MPQGFQLLDNAFRLARRGPRLRWDVIDVRFGRGTGGALVAELSNGFDAPVRRLFPAPVSFRVQDERELLPYWRRRDEEGVAPGALYQLGDSAYLSEISLGVSGFLEQALTHFLIAGAHTCLEVIATAAPQLERAPQAA